MLVENLHNSSDLNEVYFDGVRRRESMGNNGTDFFTQDNANQDSNALGKSGRYYRNNSYFILINY
jgi:hypothetical protein